MRINQVVSPEVLERVRVLQFALSVGLLPRLVDVDYPNTLRGEIFLAPLIHSLHGFLRAHAGLRRHAH